VTLTLTGTDEPGQSGQAHHHHSRRRQLCLRGPAPWHLHGDRADAAAGTATARPRRARWVAGHAPGGTVPSASRHHRAAAGREVRALENNFGEVEHPTCASARHGAAALHGGLPGSYRISVRNAGPLPARRLHGQRPPAHRPDAGRHAQRHRLGLHRRCRRQQLHAAPAAACSRPAPRGAVITASVNVAAAAGPAAVNNAVMVDGGGEIDRPPPQRRRARRLQQQPGQPARMHAGGAAQRLPHAHAGAAAASMSGTVWYDSGSARVPAGQRRPPPAGLDQVEIIDTATGQWWAPPPGPMAATAWPT
jgi:hypothetical protein